MKPLTLSPLLLLAVGCHPAASGYTPTPAPPVVPVAVKTVTNVKPLLPLTVDNRWVYAYRSEAFRGDKPLGQTDGEVTYRVAKKNPDGSATMELVQNDVVQDRQGIRSDDQTVYQTSEVVKVESGMRDVAYSPPQPIVLLPLTAGKHFTWSGFGVMGNGKAMNGRSDSEILAPERVDTGMGPISAIPVVTNVSFGSSKSQNTTWFRPGVGMMRYRQETTTPDGVKTVFSLTLKNYTIQK